MFWRCFYSLCFYYITLSNIISSAKCSDFYSFTVEDIHGKETSLEKYRGKVSLVVNVASECGFTDGHYTQLVKLQRIIGKSRLFNVLAFPCNQFGSQEPGNNGDIFRWGIKTYDVNFPMFAKVDVYGPNVAPCWQYLNDATNSQPSWNFNKYLIDTDGTVIDSWGPWSGVEDVTPSAWQAVKRAENSKNTPKQSNPTTTADKQTNHVDL